MRASSTGAASAALIVCSHADTDPNDSLTPNKSLRANSVTRLLTR